MKIHGHSYLPSQKHNRGTPTYVSWYAMRQRCLYQKHPQYKNYGGRGISICERWLNFKGFLEDMGVRPEGKSLDRIDTNGNYEPANCRWATKAEQRRNTRRSHFLTYAGETLTVTEWAARAGIPQERLQKRIEYGIGMPEAISKGRLPPRKRKCQTSLQPTH